VQCVNPFTESVKLPSGFVVGRFHFVQEGDMVLNIVKISHLYYYFGVMFFYIIIDSILHHFVTCFLFTHNPSLLFLCPH